MNLAILGNGGFGTAMALCCHAAGHRVRLWGHDVATTAAIAQTRCNPRYLPEAVALPVDIDIGSDGARTLHEAQAVLVAVPTQHLRAVVGALAAHLPAAVPLVSLAKGLEERTALRASQVLRDVVGAGHDVLALSGPSHAEELALGLPAILVLAGDSPNAGALQTALSSTRVRVYRQHDLLGVELCGALKNVMALAAGIGDGLGYGDNAKAAIIARGIVEMARYGVAEGADPRTFWGIAGVGDLAVTAFSRHGRNRAFGERIGRGETVAQILATTVKVAEGVWTSRVVRDRARQIGVDMPITDGVCAVLFEDMPPALAVRALMERGVKDELA